MGFYVSLIHSLPVWSSSLFYGTPCSRLTLLHGLLIGWSLCLNSLWVFFFFLVVFLSFRPQFWSQHFPETYLIQGGKSFFLYSLILNLENHYSLPSWLVLTSFSVAVINTMTNNNLGSKGLLELQLHTTVHHWGKPRQELKQRQRGSLLTGFLTYPSYADQGWHCP